MVHSVTGAKQYVYVRLQYVQCGYNITKAADFCATSCMGRRRSRRAAVAAPQFAAHGQQSCNGSILADCCASAGQHRWHSAALLRQQQHVPRHRTVEGAVAACARSPAYNCALQAAVAAIVGLQFIARLRPIVLQFRGVSHSSYLAAADLNDLLSPFKVTVFFLRLLSKQTPATCSTRQCLDFEN